MQLEGASTHNSSITHTGNILLPLADCKKLHARKNRWSAAASALGKSCRESLMSLAWLVLQCIAAGKPSMA